MNRRKSKRVGTLLDKFVGTLEPRVLFAAFGAAGDSLQINFQPSSAPTVPGYVVDAGATYGARGGQTYGWTVSHADSVVDRNIHADQRLDTYVAVKKAARWELAVPNGQYTIRVSVGDAGGASNNNVWLEGVQLFDYQALAANRFASDSLTVNVSDGRLTLGIGSAAAGTTRINFLEVTAGTVSPPTSPPPTSPPPTSPPPTSPPPPTVPPPPSGGVKFNFQPAAAPTVPGFVVDSGLTYGSRDGQVYGWTVSHTDAVVDRNLIDQQLLDTNVSVKKGSRWELAVPNGTYTVRVSAGDAGVATINNVWVEGQLLFNYQSQLANHFSARTITIPVADGRLTIGIGSAATDTTRINFVEVDGSGISPPTSPPPTSPPPTSPPPTSPPPTSPPPTSPPPALPVANSEVRINFQPANATPVPGYLVDSGGTFAVHNSQSYGWSTFHGDALFNRDSHPDQRLDTGVGVKQSGRWELAVPNGQYRVTVGVGDAAAASTNNVWIEGVQLFNYMPLAANNFKSATLTVPVSDGRLLLGVGSAVTGLTRINYIEVAQVNTAPPAAPVVSATVANTAVTLTWPAVANAAAYDLYRISEADYANGLPYQRVISGVTGHRFTDYPGSQQTAYRYQVTAVNTAGASAPSPTVIAVTGVHAAGGPTVLPADPIRQAVFVSPGQVTLPSGETIDVAGQTVVLEHPDVLPFTWTGAAPPNYTGASPLLRWPDNSANLHPPVDTTVLGGPYHSIVPGSVIVTDAVTGHVYSEGVDYKLNLEWGQLMNLDSRLGLPGSGAIRIDYTTTLQRLDLLQVLPNGSIGVKRGVSAPVMPQLPEADAGAVPLAGIHVNTIDGAVTSGFRILERDIHLIRDIPPVAPINPDAIANTRAKLAAGQAVNVAFFGDSITAGAEATNWLADPSLRYTSLVTAGLQSRYPTATVTATQAHLGGVSTLAGEATFQNLVLNPHAAGHRVDLLVIAMGMNDLGKPSLDPVKAKLRDYISRAKAVGMDVLLVTPMQSNPYYDAVFTDWVPREQVAAAIRDVGVADGIATADVFTEWMNQSARGIAPVSQLHNWLNHPGTPGHRLYADTILRFFPG